MQTKVAPFLALLAVTLMYPAAPAAQIVRQPAVPLDVRVPAAPAWVPARDGSHALYELHLASYRALPLELLRLDILDDADGGLLASFEGEALKRILARPGLEVAPEAARFIDGGQTAVLFVELIREPGASLPSAIRHALTLRRAADKDQPPAERMWRLDTAAVQIQAAPRHVLGPPLRGAGWLAANGLGNDASHRRTLFAIDGRVRISQRYAIDFIQIGTNGLVADRDPPANEDFHGYGAELLAVADGVIVAAEDGIPENVPFSEETATEITLETIAGNHVVLDIGGAHVLYGHLQPGSLAVQAGARVRRGDVLGRLGNSGNSDAPHLHIQVTDLAAPLAAEGLPFVFEEFSQRGRIDNLDAWLESRKPWMPEGTASSARRGELPLDRDVVDFPGGLLP